MPFVREEEKVRSSEGLAGGLTLSGWKACSFSASLARPLEESSYTDTSYNP